MTDREQIRRDAEAVGSGPAMSYATHCLVLLAELEQAERERDRLRSEWLEPTLTGRKFRELTTRAEIAEARLAKADTVLVEALRNWLEDVDEAEREDLHLHDLQQKIGAMFLGYGGGFNHEDDLRAALADREQT